MALITITGRPGFGKTLNMTNEARLNFNAINPPLKIWFIENILRKNYIYTINEYSNYPIRFKKERKKPYYYYDFNGDIKESKELYSWKVRLYDMRIKYKFNEGANFYIDEIQAMYDSMEYKDFPDSIAHFFQAHRHMEYNNIYVNSQSLSRIIKRVLVISESYWNITSYKTWWIFSITNYKITWELASSKEEKFLNEDRIDIEYRNCIFISKWVYEMYNSKYLHGLLDHAKTYITEQWDNLKMSGNDIFKMFFISDYERKEISQDRY